MAGSVAAPSNFALSNLLAPASGTTHGAKFVVTLNNNAVDLNLPGYTAALGDYKPQAMMVDNSGNTADFIVLEQSAGWQVTIPAGALITFQYPGVPNQVFTFSSTGQNVCNVWLYDWPAFPQTIINGTFSQGTPVIIGNLPIPVTMATAPAAVPATYTGALASSIVTGGTAVTVFGAGTIVNGGVVTNPTTATELLFVNPIGAATLVESGNTFALAQGQSFSFGAATGAISVNAATNGHAFSAVRW